MGVDPQRVTTVPVARTPDIVDFAVSVARAVDDEDADTRGGRPTTNQRPRNFAVTFLNIKRLDADVPKSPTRWLIP